jgi:hypothetical protein
VQQDLQDHEIAEAEPFGGDAVLDIGRHCSVSASQDYPQLGAGGIGLAVSLHTLPPQKDASTSKKNAGMFWRYIGGC